METDNYELMVIMQILVIVVPIMAVAFFLRSRRVKATKERLSQTEGKHTAEFKIGPSRGFVAEDILYFYPGSNNNLLRKVEWKQAEHVSSYRMNMTCYVKFYNRDGKQVGGTSGTLIFSNKPQVEEFYEFVRQYAGWIEIR